MRTLFFRIFIWFWVAMVVLAVTFAGTIVATRFTTAREHLHASKRAVAISARAAALTYQQLGVQGLRDLIDTSEENANYVYFFDKQQTELQGLSAPPEVRALAGTVLLGSSGLRLKEKCLNRPPWIGCGAIDSNGVSYALVMRFRQPRLVSPIEWAILIPALVSVAGLVCFWLAKYLTQPISRLRWLTGRFADGDLQARVEDYSAFRHSEELQGLAHDFDHMAERIQGLIEKQKHLLWDISHELRTPLTRIALAIGLTRQRLAGQLPKEFSRIDREIERLNHLIGQILTIAQLEAGTGLEDRQDVDLSVLVEEIAEDAALEGDVQEITIRIECKTSPHVLASRELLRMAIENVLRNAVRHAPRASTVRIELLQPEGKTSLAIYDQGPGIQEKDLPKLFEPFFRSADTRSKYPGGTGLGLAMTRRIVEWHSGSIAARNQGTGGLVVTMLFPCEESSSTQLHGSLCVHDTAIDAPADEHRQLSGDPKLSV
jgi:two-component system sensor histidine kinase CpxA